LFSFFFLSLAIEIDWISTTIRKGQQLILFNSFLEILTHTFYTLGAAKRSVVNTHTHTHITSHHITEGEREIRLTDFAQSFKRSNNTHTHKHKSEKRLREKKRRPTTTRQ
jgi:hypothetical protein